MIRGLVAILVVVVAGAAALVYSIGRGWLSEPQTPGVVTASPIPTALLQERNALQQQSALAAGVAEPDQILFGDLHVHTTYSLDAFALSMPLSQGEGAHPPADACDFARYCSALDFWSINDHAEAMTPGNWRDTVASIRQCNAVTQQDAPDSVAFLGWEWTQIGSTAENHYGHKNVVLRHLDDAHIPTRPIAARLAGVNDQGRLRANPFQLGLLPFVARDRTYLSMVRYLLDLLAVDPCPTGVAVRDLPDDCRESAATPAELFAKLDDWGHEALVIPHGTAWGFYTPLGSSWDKQLDARQHDVGRQGLIEVYSGHGNSEEFRAWREIQFDATGGPTCPPRAPDYLPSCQRAGEIIEERCRADGESDEKCRQRAGEARQHYVEGNVQGFLTVPGTTAEDWLDAGQCADCFQPAFNYRPRSSVQYMLALSNLQDPAAERFRFGFIASSDSHSARPGTGYKEFQRREMTESGFGSFARGIIPGLEGDSVAPEARSVPWEPPEPGGFAFFQQRETERSGSFFVTGGLVAAHAAGRSREAIWAALEEKTVYGTSGPRILLWFDLLNGTGEEGEARLPMGSEVGMARRPEFEVRAVGSLEQKPGCPDYAVNALSPDRLHRLCRGECYHPSDRRRRITRIEVVRIRPRVRPRESLGRLIEDPWQVLPCPADEAGCRVQFEDPDFTRETRDTVYYVRAIEEPSLAVNADDLRCERDARGRCLAVHPCPGKPYDDDCLATTEQRAWSSPIYVDFAP